MRLLPIALASVNYQCRGDQISFAYQSGNVEITIIKETERKIASLALPVMHLEFCFNDVSDTEQDALLTHFFKIYQRGGG